MNVEGYLTIIREGIVPSLKAQIELSMLIFMIDGARNHFAVKFNSVTLVISQPLAKIPLLVALEIPMAFLIAMSDFWIFFGFRAS